jgi:hypothetical protein
MTAGLHRPGDADVSSLASPISEKPAPSAARAPCRSCDKAETMLEVKTAGESNRALGEPRR